MNVTLVTLESAAYPPFEGVADESAPPTPSDRFAFAVS